MEEKQILIRIRTEFKKTALNQLQNALRSFATAATSTAGALRSMSGPMSNAVGNLANFGKSIVSTINPLRAFHTLFGRVTLAMLTWQAWRWAAQGFQGLADAIFGANAAIQTATVSFTTLTGSSEKAGRLVGIVRDVAMQTGVSFSDLVFESRRLTTQLGQNEAAFQKVSKAAVALSVLDPIQGISGAMFALSNFLEGTAQGARSLAQRFELPFGVLKQALQDAKSPIEALELALERLGIDVEDLIQRGRYTLPVIVSNLREMLRYFIQMSTQPFITRLTQDLARLRDFVEANRDAILGLARAIGQMLERLYLYARVLLRQIFPALGAIFDIKLPEFKDKPKQALKDIAAEAAEETAKAAADAQVAAADAVLEALKAKAREQKAAIRDLEAWVDEAAKVVQNKRDELRIFDIMTADIPERFTRGRRRQMELDLIAAEQEKRRRQEALDLARRQLEATNDQIAAQRDLISALKDTVKELKDLEDEQAFGDFGFAEVDISDSEAAIDEWAQKWGEKLSEVELKLKNFMTKVAQLMRGLFGMEPLTEPGFPGQIVPFENLYETGRAIRETIGDIKEAISGAWQTISEIVSSLNQKWQGLDPDLKKFILAVAGGLMFRKLATVIGLVLTLDDPTNLWGPLLIILGLPGAATGLVKLTVQLLAKVAGPAANALLSVLGSISTAAGGGVLGVGAIVLPLVLIAEIWFGRKELSKWISGERVEELKAIIKIVGVKEAGEQILEGAGESVAKNVLRMDDEQIQTFGQWLADTATKLGLVFGGELATSSQETIAGAESSIEEAATKGAKNPIVKVFEAIKEAIVGKSIVPDMLREVRYEFERFPSQLIPPLQMLMRLLVDVMTMIKIRWAADWAEMVTIAQLSMERISVLQQQMAATQADLSGAMATASASPPSIQMTGQDGDSNVAMSLQLDAIETARLMQEGVYRAILSLPMPRGA